MSFALLLLAFASLALYAFVRFVGGVRWSAGTATLRARLGPGRAPNAVPPPRFDARSLDGLPAPVARYFRSVLRDGQPLIATTRLRHRGTIDLGKGWKPFTSDQLVVADPPGFDWNATVRIAPGFDALVHDAYVAGEGILHATVLGMIPVASVRGTPEAAAGELLRHLAEAPWSPTNLLPARGVQWTPIDEQSARATLVDGATSATLTFRFGDDGAIESVHAESRPRDVGGAMVPTPWEGRFSNVAERDGMRIPLAAEVAWLTPEGRRPYWRGDVVDVAYTFESAETA